MDLRDWVNSGLMTFFFFVVGLEARREFDLGELRERRRVALPLLAGLGGMVVPVAIYLAINAGRAVGARLGRRDVDRHRVRARHARARRAARFPDRLRAFLLTVVVVDDLVALVVIAIVYSEHVALHARCWSRSAIFGGARRSCAAPACATGSSTRCSASPRGSRCSSRASTRSSSASRWACSTYAYPAARGDLERATDLFRRFREQPTPELARAARVGLAAAISPNERLQQLYHPWTSYVIVPLFALANAGIAIDGGFLSRAFTSPITLGILVGYVVGKPLGIAGTSLAGHAAEPRPAAAAGRLGRRRRRRRDRRHRLHRLAADRDARVRRRPARGGEARRAGRRARARRC